MTRDEFVLKYSEYHTLSESAALAEAQRANDEGIDGELAVAINLGLIEGEVIGGSPWGVMLMSTVPDLLEPWPNLRVRIPGRTLRG